MKYRIAILLVTAGLIGVFAIPSDAHTTHAHYCTSSGHGYVSDGFPWRHKAVVIMEPHPDGFERWVVVTHQMYVNQVGYVTQHTLSTSHCLVA